MNPLRGRMVGVESISHREAVAGGLMKGVVLMIEDEEHIRIVFRDAMFDEGVMVVGVPTGEAGVEFYRQHDDEISLVVLDLSLPGMDGEETFTLLQAINPDVKVVVSSGFPNEDITKKFVGRGVAGFLQKPYDYTTLVESMNKYLSKNGG